MTHQPVRLMTNAELVHLAQLLYPGGDKPVSPAWIAIALELERRGYCWQTGRWVVASAVEQV